jgi:hypothetical protein
MARESDESDEDDKDEDGNGVSVNQGPPPVTTMSGRRVRPPDRMNVNAMKVKELNAMHIKTAQELRKKLSRQKVRAGGQNHQFLSSVKWTQLKS